MKNSVRFEMGDCGNTWLLVYVGGFLRRQELRELRLLQKEEQRAQQQLSNKLQQQREQIYRRFEQETTVSQSVLSTVVWCFYLAHS